MKKVALITNYNIPDKLNAAMAVAERLVGKVERILIPISHKDRILRGHLHKKEFMYLSPEELYKSVELVIVLGGDGFVLDAARRAAPNGIPILGINMGRVGYMTELEIDELDKLDMVFEGKYRLDERAMLRVEIKSASGQVKSVSYALNDAVIANGSTARIVDLELSDHGELVNTYRADGIVVATPTGSTAYSLSAGGPIIDPKLSCFCVTPICPHPLYARPLIFPDDATIEVKNTSQREKNLFLTVDGRANYELSFGESFRITRSPLHARFIRVKEGSFYDRLRQKMTDN
jgi:NAD+ kinase